MYRLKRWHMQHEGESLSPAAIELAGRLKVSPLIGQVLVNRGIREPREAEEFLRPSLKNLVDPSLLPGVAQAAERIARAIHDRQKIVVYGDYDADGITATSILWHAITLLGGQVEIYIPHRIDEGYGLNAEALRQIIDNGAQLIVTVDCGITAVAPARIARQRGIDLIITDHHDWHIAPASSKPLLPDCHTLVHPRLPADPPYPNPHLCGAGVAFKLAWGIGKAAAGATRVAQVFREFLIEATALAALGTIADVVPLVGENRVLAHFGLTGLQESKQPGIRALIASASRTGKKLDSYDVGFMLAPRLNASGRLGDATMAVELLTTAGDERAAEIAGLLTEQNEARQSVQKDIVRRALERIEANGWAAERNGRAVAGCRALVVDGEGWHAGVIGIVAAKIVERYCRPTIVISKADGVGHGSGRSIAGFHLARALEHCHEFLLSHGGHEMAAGLRIDAGRIEDFRRAFCGYADSAVTDEMLRPRLELDCLAQTGQLTEAVARDLERIGPFGQGNRRPILHIADAIIAAPPRRVGRTAEHLQLQIRQRIAGRLSPTIRCIAFGAAELESRLAPDAAIDLAAEVSINDFRDRINVELKICDIHFRDDDPSANS